MNETQLLVNTILFLAFMIFLYLVGGETSSYPTIREPNSQRRIPASVSSVIEGYVQLSGLSEMELRK